MNSSSDISTSSSKSKAKKVLITGMSGTRKSTALEKLSERGYRVADTDSDVRKGEQT